MRCSAVGTCGTISINWVSIVGCDRGEGDLDLGTRDHTGTHPDKLQSKEGRRTKKHCTACTACASCAVRSACHEEKFIVMAANNMFSVAGKVGACTTTTVVVPVLQQ